MVAQKIVKYCIYNLNVHSQGFGCWLPIICFPSRLLLSTYPQWNHSWGIGILFYASRPLVNGYFSYFCQMLYHASMPQANCEFYWLAFDMSQSKTKWRLEIHMEMTYQIIIYGKVTRNRLDAHSSSTACTLEKQIRVINNQ